MDLVITNADAVWTPEAGDRVVTGDILVRQGAIVSVGGTADAGAATPRLDASGCIVVPGLVNTHHHMFQSLTRATGHDEELFGWLGSLWGRWTAHDAEWQEAATAVSCAELLLSGCTTVADHHYLPHRGAEDAVTAQAAAAARLGIRLLQAVGSMDVSDRDGGLAPPALCEDADSFLSHAGQLIKSGHDASPASRRRIALAPCHPLTVTERYVRGTVELARSNGVRLHTHLAEARDEEAATVAMTGLRPVDLLESWGFLGADVWIAHAVHLSDADIKALASSGTGVSSCPSSNLRLGSGIARIRDLVDVGVPVGLGVDGSASNDAGNLLLEARQLLLASRARGLARGLSAREALTIATAGGAAVLGWDEVGRIAPGFRGDLAIFGLDGLAGIGTESDLVAGLLLSPPPAARHVVVDGEVVVRDGVLVNADVDEIASRARAVIRRLA